MKAKGTSLVVQNLPSNAGGVGSISNWEAKISHALQPKNQNTEQKQYCNTFNKVLKIKKKKKNRRYKRCENLAYLNDCGLWQRLKANGEGGGRG